MTLTTSYDFLNLVLPTLISGSERVHALFASYTEIGNYPSGLVEANKKGLTIHVQNGNLEYSDATLMGLFAPDQHLNKLASQMMDHEAALALQTVEDAIKAISCSGALLLAVIYAGLSAFNGSITLAQKIKCEHPAAKVVILTCDCKLDKKEKTLLSMLEKEEIEAAIVTPYCGGVEVMGNIVAQLVTVWPAKS